MSCWKIPVWQVLVILLSVNCIAAADEPPVQHWLWSTAHAIPKETTSEGSGYFSIVEGHNKKLYIGTAKYGSNAYLVEFDPATKQMLVVLDAQKEIGKTATGFAAQAKFHTRNNVGASGKIYLGTKQGYPKDGETRADYLGGHPMVFDPVTGQTQVFEIPVAQQGIISVTPDESRGVAYVSTCSDERPIESTHFMRLDLKTGKYTDLLDCRHMYAFIVVDWKGRAYHPILGGEIARFDPETNQLERLKQTIDGQPPTVESHLADEQSHPINWEISPDRKTLYAVAMSTNQLYAYDLTGDGKTLVGRSLGPLVSSAESTDCRALCVAPDGRVWMGVNATMSKGQNLLRVVSYTPGSTAPQDHGAIAIGNPDYTEFTDDAGKPLPHHHGVHSLSDGTLLPRYVVMGICAHSNGRVYVTTLAPFTVHEIKIPRVAAVVTEYRHNTHADVIVGRLVQTDTLDDLGATANLKLAGLFTDQIPENETSRKWSGKYGFPIYPTVEQALSAGTDSPLGVDGIILVAEHGTYEDNEFGNTIYPKRRLFTQIANAVEASGRKNVPYFSDKHLADNWADAKWIYDRAKELDMPMMAGSSLPACWRFPQTDVHRGAKLKQIVGISYGSLDSYGFHGLEMLQCLAERRSNGETGVKSVQTFVDDAVWKAGEDGVYDAKLFDEALARMKIRIWEKNKKTVREAVRSPVLFVVEYNDGLRANLLTLNGAVGEWSAAWQYEDDSIDSTLFSLQDARPFAHFTYLLMGVERLMQTGQPAWPVERTLLTSGVLDALLISKSKASQQILTPYLNVSYQSKFNWRQPPPPPPDRPNASQ